MTDFLPDTPVMTTAYCPVCEPARDPLAELLVSVPCHRHQEYAGVDDDAVRTDSSYIAHSDAGGESNVNFCKLLHRGRR